MLDPETYKKISESWDFFNLNEAADLLFHVREHQLSLPQIKDWLEELGLEFLGIQDRKNVPVQHARFFPSDPQGLNLDNWTKFEEKYPDTFSTMYRFWCRKN